MIRGHVFAPGVFWSSRTRGSLGILLPVLAKTAPAETGPERTPRVHQGNGRLWVWGFFPWLLRRITNVVPRPDRTDNPKGVSNRGTERMRGTASRNLVSWGFTAIPCRKGDTGGSRCHHKVTTRHRVTPTGSSTGVMRSPGPHRNCLSTLHVASSE